LTRRNHKYLVEILDKYSQLGLQFVELYANERIQVGFNDSTSVMTKYNFERVDSVSREEEFRAGKLLDILEKYNQAILIGEPGAGKTTALEYMTWHFADKLINDRISARFFPVFLPLFTVGSDDSNSIIAAIKEKVNIDQFPSRVLFLLDGINEVKRDQRVGVFKAVNRLISKYPISKVLITSRPGVYLNRQNHPSRQESLL
jgi:predicted NACHT family NTPase